MLQVCIPRAYRGTGGFWMRVMRVRACPSVGPSSSFSSTTTTTRRSVHGRFCVPSAAATPRTEKLVVVWPGGDRGETRACDRVRRRLVRARARAHPTRPTTTRPPNSDLVRTASHVSRRPVDHDRATPHSPSMRLPPCTPRGASVYRSVSDNNISIYF